MLCPVSITMEAQYIRNGVLDGAHGSQNPPDFWGVCDFALSTPELYDEFSRHYFDSTTFMWVDTAQRYYYSVDSSTFCILRAKPEAGGIEHIFTRLIQPLEKNYCYQFKIFLRHTYFGTGANDLTHPVRLQIWGGMDSCISETDYDNFELLYSSELIDNQQWEEYTFTFSVKRKDYPYFFLRPVWDIPDYMPEPYRGIIFLDSVRLEQLNYVGPPFEDTALYYYSISEPLRLDAPAGATYLWNPPQVVNEYDDQSVFLVEYTDTIYASVANSPEECPASFKYHIAYICDTVYKGFPLRRDTIVLSSTNPVLLSAGFGYDHDWYLWDDSLGHHEPFYNFNSYSDWITDTITYTDSIKDFKDCRFPEEFTIIRRCDLIQPEDMIDRGDYYYNYQPIIMEASEGEEYVWDPPDRISSDTSQVVQFAGYQGMVEEVIIYDVMITDVYNCNFTERFNIIRDCDTLNPEHKSFEMLRVDTNRIETYLFESQGTVVTGWQPPTGLSCTNCLETTARPLSSQTYEIYLLDTLGCERHEIYIINIEMIIPNVITPNGDMKNDEFIIPGLPEGASIHIFDKEGNSIYYDDNYGYGENGWWDGSEGNKTVHETGTYWYVLEIPGKEKPVKGFVFVKK